MEPVWWENGRYLPMYSILDLNRRICMLSSKSIVDQPHRILRKRCCTKRTVGKTTWTGNWSIYTVKLNTSSRKLSNTLFSLYNIQHIIIIVHCLLCLNQIQNPTPVQLRHDSWCHSCLWNCLHQCIILLLDLILTTKSVSSVVLSLGGVLTGVDVSVTNSDLWGSGCSVTR